MTGRFYLPSLVALAFLSPLPLWGGEFAILTNGARLKIDRHENIDGVLRLYAGKGYTELPAGAVATFEFFEDPPPAPVTPPPMPAKSTAPRENQSARSGS